jgi:hypothetical protein
MNPGGIGLVEFIGIAVPIKMPLIWTAATAPRVTIVTDAKTARSFRKPDLYSSNAPRTLELGRMKCTNLMSRT